jgi:ketosteroid isomerase-like protein
MIPNKIQSFFDDWIGAHKRHDIEGVMSAYAEDSIAESPISGHLVGRDAIAKSTLSLWESFPDMRYDFDRPLIVGDYAVLSGAISGTDTVGFLGQEPTGKKFRIFAVFLLRMERWLIVHDRRVYDFSGMLQQLAGTLKETEDSASQFSATLDRALAERELSIAGEIQRALLPPPRYAGTGFSVAATSVPCRVIGGDFFDYFALPNGTFAFALGDVSGKGPPAALMAGTIQGIFGSQAQTGGPAGETLTHVNQVLSRRTLEARFATVVYGTLTRGGQFTYSNAGHNPPILISREGQRRLKTGGLILGVFKDARYEEETIQLSPGDTLVVFSDGITEAVNADGEEFGEDRLLACFLSASESSADDLLKKLLDAWYEFSGSTAQRDDATALVLRYSG